MASSKHLQLSTFIKTVHQNLRDDAKEIGFENAWQKHCANEQTLKEYAEAMRELATKHWEENGSTRIESRISWVHDYCIFYFVETELLRQRTREEDIARKINIDLEVNRQHNHKATLSMLDVGSCYNPFKIFPIFNVIPIDIAPASADVHKCDFINLEIVRYKPNTNEEGQINQLQECSFDIIVFSLLLEYIPCPKQRLVCCLNAYKLLRYEGLLIIITPDSKHVGANVKFMKSWRYNLARLGFSRIKYQKLSHIHCMAFRKTINPEVAIHWTKLQNESEFYPEMFIPQDFIVSEANQICIRKGGVLDKITDVHLFEELPYFIE